MKRLLLGLLLLSVSASFANTQPLPSGSQEKARKLYVSKCAKCHRFYEPTRYQETDWQDWMLRMGRKSKLSEDDQRILTAYLDQYRAGELPGRPQDKPRRK